MSAAGTRNLIIQLIPHTRFYPKTLSGIIGKKTLLTIFFANPAEVEFTGRREIIYPDRIVTNQASRDNLFSPFAAFLPDDFPFTAIAATPGKIRISTSYVRHIVKFRLKKFRVQKKIYCEKIKIYLFFLYFRAAIVFIIADLVCQPAINL